MRSPRVLFAAARIQARRGTYIKLHGRCQCGAEGYRYPSEERPTCPKCRGGEPRRVVTYYEPRPA